MPSDLGVGAGVNFAHLVVSDRDLARPVVEQARRAVEDRPYPCPRDGHERALVSSLAQEPTLWTIRDIPLEVIRPGVLVLPVWAKGANIAGGIVDKSMTDHLVFPLEAFASLASWTSRDGAVVRPRGRVNVCMGIEKVLRLERSRSAALERAPIHGRLNSQTLDAHALRD